MSIRSRKGARAGSGRNAGWFLIMASLFGLPLDDLSMAHAVDALAASLDALHAPCRTAVFVNAHAARMASEDAGFHAALRRADWRLADGIGVRLAVLLRGTRLAANLVGTDLVPALLARLEPARPRCFLFGGTEATNRAAAAHLARRWPGAVVAGRHHGYVAPAEEAALVRRINASGAALVLVGMGNPLQEEWMDRNRAALEARLCLGVGGLFRHWSGELVRASPLTRAIGLEWLQLSRQNPARFGRYASDLPRFAARALRDAAADRAARPAAARGEFAR